MNLTPQISRQNFHSFIWHIVFFSMAINFMDFDTVMPAMIIQSGGTAVQIGILTAILIGGSKIAQLFAAPFLYFTKTKKTYLLLAISVRFSALMAIAGSFYYSQALPNGTIIYLIFFFISFFSLSEAFATLSYTDILGKSLLQVKRKSFLSIRQVISSLLMFLSAFAVKKVLGTYDFPDNYAFLFLFAGLALAIASLGIWNLREVRLEKQFEHPGLISFIKLLKKELKGNKVLWSYLIIINTLGLGMGLLPFMILYAKTNIGLDPGQIGNFVILKTVGLVFSGLFLFRFANKLGYKTLLYIALIVGASLPLVGMLLSDQPYWFSLCFLMGGIYITFFNISRAGVLLEISTDSNRVLYAGIAGFGSILITIFPLLAGFVIDSLGFEVFFILTSLTILISVFFIHRLQCK
jgi:MFS family permease